MSAQRADQAPVLVMAGGTGGHIFPGIAVAAELARREVPVVWLGAAGGLEESLVPAAGIRLETLSIRALRGKGPAALLMLPLRLVRAVRTARRILARHRPRSVLALGGYVAAPGGIAAWLARVPLVVHEQNAVAGLTNRLLARFAQRVLGGFEGTPAGAEWVGNPVRAELAALPPPAERLAGRDGPVRVLVLGGSQGARALNRGAPPALAALGQALEITHQCGRGAKADTREAYRAAGLNARIEPFIDDMARAYAWADLVLCRAGALTLAELCAVGLGAVLVPYPHAVDDHQTRNAAAMVEAGAALLVQEGEGFGARLQAALGDVRARGRQRSMAEAARRLARPDAAGRIADACLEVAP